MLKPHPAILRDLVKQYEELRAQGSDRSSSETRRRTEDLAYTLCVSTGTRTVEAALAFAAEQLEADLAESAYATGARSVLPLAI